MVIGITIDHVLREVLFALQQRYIQQFGDSGITLPITNDDFFQFFKFPNREEYNKFINEDYCMEILGFASTPERSTLLDLSILDLNIQKSGHKLVLISFNDGRGRPLTLHFLSTIICPAQTIHFLKNKEDVWDICDLVITAENQIIEKKPFWKKAVKINRPFNKDVKGYNVVSFDNLSNIRHMEFMSKLFLFEKIKRYVLKRFFKNS
jgi:hypothetical protein